MREGVLHPHREEIRRMIAEGKSSKEVAEAFGVTRERMTKFAGRHKLGRWALTNDGNLSRNRMIPADFRELWLTMSMVRLAAHYHRSPSTIAEWCRKLDLKRSDDDRSYRVTGRGATVAPPSDFAEHVSKSVAELCIRYGVSKEVIGRWSKSVGYHRDRQGGRPLKPATLLRALGALDVSRNHRDMSPAGQAADYLRKYSGVWRCTPTGSPDANGTRWRRGSAILTDAELIERAERLGWDPDAWKRLAA